MAYTTKQDRKIKYALLKDRFSSLGEHPAVKLYLKWVEMSDFDKREAYSKWDKYYNEVKNTRAYLIYREMSNAFKKNDIAKIKELKEESSKMFVEQTSGNCEILEPRCINPYSFLHRQEISSYLNIKKELKDLAKISLSLEGIFN